MQRCSSLINASQKAGLVYRLFVFHTAVSMTQSSGAEIVPVHLSIIIAVISRMLSMEESNIEESILLSSLVEFVTHIYSGCVSLDELEKVIQASIYAQSREGAIRPLPGVEIEVPDGSFDTTMFLPNTIKSYKQDDFEKYR